jgi:hypothetical protein
VATSVVGTSRHSVVRRQFGHYRVASRSSNRTCRFPASGSRTRLSRLHPRCKSASNLGSDSLLMQFGIRVSSHWGENQRHAASTSPFQFGAGWVCCRKCVLPGGQNRHCCSPFQKLWSLSIVRDGFPPRAEPLSTLVMGPPLFHPGANWADPRYVELRATEIRNEQERLARYHEPRRNKKRNGLTRPSVNVLLLLRRVG